VFTLNLLRALGGHDAGLCGGEDAEGRNGEPMETTVIAYLACPGGAFRLRQKLVLQGKANSIPERR
jgi:hypothetical protein